MRKKLTLASLVSLSTLPLVMPSNDASAFPVFARKYQTSCYTCHSGFPARNAFGEAFKNNGYRWPGGDDEEHARQEQVKLGSDGWKKVFPESPWPGDIPGYAPVSLFVTGGVINYTEGTSATKSRVNWGNMATGNLLFGGTIGDNLSVVAALEGFADNNVTIASKDAYGNTLAEGKEFGTSKLASRVRAVWSFSPGVLVSVGNWASNISGAGSSTGGTANVSNVLPTPGTGIELSWTRGNTGGFNVVAGVSSNTTTPGSTTVNQDTFNGDSQLDDLRYVRAKYKLFGSGLLSGAGGVYGNEYNGLDNSITIGCGIMNSRQMTTATALTGNYKGESLFYGGDILATFSDFTGGVALSRDKDLRQNNFMADAGYYIYPWLYAKLRYSDVYNGNGRYHNPTYTPSITAYLRANVYLQASYTAYAYKYSSGTTENQDTLALNVAIGL